MIQYLQLLQKVYNSKHVSQDRTGVGTRLYSGAQLRFDLTKGFPLLTTKRLHVHSIIHELAWFLRGDTNIKYLQDNGVRIWNEWADENGNLGPVYGKQWRNYEGVDQIRWVVDEAKKNPTSRRLVVSAWNPKDLPSMALPPCHYSFQLIPIQYAPDSYYLDMIVNQRSADMFLGVPFNIASYATLLHLFAKELDMVPNDLIWNGGNVHIYNNHLEQVRLQLSRAPGPLPRLKLKPEASVFNFHPSMVEIVDYFPQNHIPAPVAV